MRRASTAYLFVPRDLEHRRNSSKSRNEEGGVPDDKSRWIKGSRLIRHAVAMSMVATPNEDVEFCMVDEKTGRKEIMKLTTRKGALYLPIDALRRMVCKTFQWGGCMIRSDDGACEIDTADDFNVVWTSYVIGEASRRRDVLEALLESIRAASIQRRSS